MSLAWEVKRKVKEVKSVKEEGGNVTNRQEGTGEVHCDKARVGAGWG